MSEEEFAALLAEARACRVCAEHLPLGPRPVLRASLGARLLIIGQAPGTKVHESGVPWNDASGDRLRQWLGISRERFYDESQSAIIPMGLCYPGRNPKGGDLPPRPECAPLWHPKLLPQLAEVKLTLLIGTYAQRFTLGKRAGTLSQTVERWRDFLPDYLPLPHPSWRTIAWERKNPWFQADLLPALRAMLNEF
jgi:uracil-DNA glycosylase